MVHSTDVYTLCGEGGGQGGGEVVHAVGGQVGTCGEGHERPHGRGGRGGGGGPPAGAEVGYEPSPGLVGGEWPQGPEGQGRGVGGPGQVALMVLPACLLGPCWLENVWPWGQAMGALVMETGPGGAGEEEK